MLFVPLWDMNPIKRVHFQYVTVAIVILNVAIYVLFETDLVFHSAARFIATYAVKPRQEAPLGAIFQAWQSQFRLVTYMFLHGSPWHLIGNMIFLFVFGDNVEDAMGHVRFALFYCLCGILAAVAHSQMTASPDLPLIGASGAISGVIGAYVVLHPNVRVWVLMPLFFIPAVPLRLSAAFAIGAWILYQLSSALFLVKTSTAWWAHVGGFAAGALLITVMKRRDVKLFDASAPGI
jgi:membrane associated rhomboid family serine protease